MTTDSLVFNDEVLLRYLYQNDGDMDHDGVVRIQQWMRLQYQCQASTIPMSIRAKA